MIEEALSILDIETEQRILEIRQRIDFICANIRASGKNQITKLLSTIKTLTVDEFCREYGGNTQYYLEQVMTRQGTAKNKKKRRNDTSEIEEKRSNKRTKGNISVNIEATSKAETEVIPRETQPLGSFQLLLSRPTYPRIDICVDPQQSPPECIKLETSVSDDSLQLLTDTQRQRLCAQVQQIQDQLESFKKSLS
ncbi:hypothetical protein BDB01DRAFT_848039 [Pilobolus umbonatus]|nr:hypothetical protein BDB01DRAFT_848039 [Pilobolus umbonatus]